VTTALISSDVLCCAVLCCVMLCVAADHHHGWSARSRQNLPVQQTQVLPQLVR